MNKHSLAFLVSFIFPFYIKAQSTAAVDSVVHVEMARQHITGLSLAVIKDGNVLISKGYGFANLKDSVPASANTIYNIGSLSKQMVAACVLSLKEQGKLQLTDHLDIYFSDIPNAWKNINIRNLLNHTSGLERESPAFNSTKHQPDSVLLRAAYNDKMHFPVGSNWEYSNLGYFILADIIRKVSGQSFEDYTTRFLSTHGMTHTTTTTQSKNNLKAIGYIYNKENGNIRESYPSPALRPSGAYSSSITDMIVWDSLQRTNILTKEDWASMWQDTVKAYTTLRGNTVYYGYGWFWEQSKKHNLVHHNGSISGFCSDYWKYMDENTSIILLTNAYHVSLDRLTFKIHNIINATNLEEPLETKNEDK